MKSSRIKVLTKTSSAAERDGPQSPSTSKLGIHKDDQVNSIKSDVNDPAPVKNHLPPQPLVIFEEKAQPFKLIEEREWNIISSEPDSETPFFRDGHSAMSIVSVMGSKGSGKSSLLNKIAGRDVFETYNSVKSKRGKLQTRHITRGIDVYSTHHRILLDSQPMLASSVFEDFLTGYSSSQFPKSQQLSDPMTSCQMISIQLATFLIAVSDYVIFVCDWLVDIHMLKLISTAIMMIGEDNLRAKLIVFGPKDKGMNAKSFSKLTNPLMMPSGFENFFDDEQKLIDHIAPYSDEKCELYCKDKSTFTGRNWLASCQRIWNSTIRNSSMFIDYATMVSGGH